MTELRHSLSRALYRVSDWQEMQTSILISHYQNLMELSAFVRIQRVVK
jgi:hypothetical protein